MMTSQPRARERRALLLKAGDPPGAESCPRTILVVDDDRSVTKLLEAGLAGAGYEVRVANDSRSAQEDLAVKLLTISVSRRRP